MIRLVIFSLLSVCNLCLFHIINLPKCLIISPLILRIILQCASVSQFFSSTFFFETYAIITKFSSFLGLNLFFLYITVSWNARLYVYLSYFQYYVCSNKCSSSFLSLCGFPQYCIFLFVHTLCFSIFLETVFFFFTFPY